MGISAAQADQYLCWWHTFCWFYTPTYHGFEVSLFSYFLPKPYGVAAQRKIEMAASYIGDMSQLRKLGMSVVHRNTQHGKG